MLTESMMKISSVILGYNPIPLSPIFIFVAKIILKVVTPLFQPPPTPLPILSALITNKVFIAQPRSLSLSLLPILNLFKVSLSISKMFVVAKRVLLLFVYAFNFVLCIILFVIIIVIVVCAFFLQ